ncbi:YgjV family protein [Butyrivibrio proteoclasticus]|uniref:YgjV family protein n=1 Tax=Butyrivibrio proteoclasticus TaxID=43305 RepID=UPI0024187FE0
MEVLMNTSTLIEAFGYLGSALVLVSFLMVSVVKLRIVNTIGSTIFTIYAFIIHSYPTALMNLCLVLINIYYLIKLSNTKVSYDFVKTDDRGSLFNYLVDLYRQDIEKCFPGIDTNFDSANASYMICNNGKPVGIAVGKKEDKNLELLLDYSIPEYRDFSIGKFLYEKLAQEGISKVIYKGSDLNHKAYLSHVGFVDKGGFYEKEL